ncbi:MAG: MarR family winged helix-turn-helix transcriptional regulator [Nocardioidaceae bacterium]
MEIAEGSSHGGPKADPAYHPVPAPLAGTLGYLLHRAHVRSSGVAWQLLPEGSHPKHFAVLEMLDATRFGSQLELAEALCVNRTIMVSIVDQLAEDGYVERRRNPEDRRRYLLELSAAGRSHLAALRARAGDGNQLLTAPLSTAEVAGLNDLLRPIALQRLTHDIPDELLNLTAFLVVYGHFHMASLAAPRLSAKLGMHPRHHAVLAVLADLGPVPQQRLAAEMQVGGATVVEIIDALEETGRVRRRPGTDDRRTNDLVVTAKGHRDLAKSDDILRGVEADALKALSAPGRDQLVTLLHKLVTGS